MREGKLTNGLGWPCSSLIKRTLLGWADLAGCLLFALSLSVFCWLFFFLVYNEIFALIFSAES